MSVPTGGGYYQTAPQVNFDWLSKGWDYFKQNPGVWVVALILGGVLATLATFILAIATGVFSIYYNLIRSGMLGSAPSPSFTGNPFLFEGKIYLFIFLLVGVSKILLGGYYRVALRQIRGEQVIATDFLQIGDVALPLFVLGVLEYIILAIGSVCIIPALIAQALLMFAPLLIVDRKLGPIDAIKASFNLLKSQWVMAAVYYVVASLVAGLGSLLCGVGALLTYPMFIISIAVGYIAFTQTQQPLPSYGAPQEGVWPPPPNTDVPSPPNPGVWPPSNNQPPPAA